jgi:probable DNA metabolism protein
MIYLIDGSLESILCAVFEWFERKPGKIRLATASSYHPDAFSEAFVVYNDHRKADRVWKGLQKKLPATWLRRLYCAFLSELPDCHFVLFEFACYIFSNPGGAEANYGNSEVLRLSQMARMVEREKHRMEAFIRFKEAEDGLFYCSIDPDFNILPLIMGHFKNRYADQQWIIYDVKRHYGLYFNLENVTEVNFTDEPELRWKNGGENTPNEKEKQYATLWKDYFKSANIAARKNTKLHVRHVPKRYWKYLTEIG